jgi:Domain of unknown function (DUF4345)
MDRAAGAVTARGVETRLLQLCVFLAASVAVFAGLSGAISGASFFHLAGDTTASSHVHYLSGLLLAIGLGFWSTIPDITHHTGRIRLLAAIVIVGGLSRLSAIFTDGVPNGVALFALANETAVPILLCLWQARLARLAP